MAALAARMRDLLEPVPISQVTDDTRREGVLAHMLRGRQFEGWKFRRQVQIGPWVVDFCCYELKLILELDGGIHRLTEDRDAERDADLFHRGFTVLRFDNGPALTNPNIVLDAVRAHARAVGKEPPHPSC